MDKKRFDEIKRINQEILKHDYMVGNQTEHVKELIEAYEEMKQQYRSLCLMYQDNLAVGIVSGLEKVKEK